MSKLFEGREKKFYLVDAKYVLVIGADTEAKSKEDHPLFDERVNEKLEREWIDNLKLMGVREPVIVRKEGEDAVVVAGRRRTLGLRLANEELVKEGKTPWELPIVGEKDTDDLEALEIMILENFGRKEPNPMQKSLLLKYWWERPENVDKTDADAAVRFVVTTTSIRNWKKMWALSAPLKKSVMKREITPEAAADLADLPAAEQVEKLKELKEKTGGKPVTSRATQTERRQRKGSVAATAYTPPKITVLRKVAEDEGAMSKLPDLVVRAIRFVVGLSDGSDLPELKALVDETPGRGKRASTGPKLTKAQETVLSLIDEAKGELLASEAKKSPTEGLMKLGLVERYTGKDGLLYIRKFDPSRPPDSPAPLGAATSKKGKKAKAQAAPVEDGGNGAGAVVDPDSVQIPDVETLETMPAKELVQLTKDLGIDMNTPKLKGLKGKELQSARVTEVLKVKKARAKAAKNKPAEPPPAVAEA